MQVPRSALDELRAKYAEMLAMRLAHTSGDEDATKVRAQMGALAARFPGALRELDDLELEEIRRRVGALDEVLRERRDVEPWMSAVAVFHALARGALVAKRWLAGRKKIDVRLARAYLDAVPSLPFPQDAGAWASDLARIATPPAGRLTAVIFARVARTLGTTEGDARRLVFGPPRRSNGGPRARC